MNSRGFRIVWVILMLGLQGCASTGPAKIATVEGNLPTGILDRALEIVGIVSLETKSGNVSSANSTHFVQATVEVPVGTAVIVPMLDGWLLGYGSAQPDPANPENAIQWTPEDQNWGLGRVSITVTRLNPPNTVASPPVQTAELSIAFHLGDDGLDDPWFGAASYSLLCLGVPGASLREWKPLGYRPPRFVAVPSGR
jgi:hypothetical protein